MYSCRDADNVIYKKKAEGRTVAVGPLLRMQMNQKAALGGAVFLIIAPYAAQAARCTC